MFTKMLGSDKEPIVVGLCKGDGGRPIVSLMFVLGDDAAAAAAAGAAGEDAGEGERPRVHSVELEFEDDTAGWMKAHRAFRGMDEAAARRGIAAGVAELARRG